MIRQIKDIAEIDFTVKANIVCTVDRNLAGQLLAINTENRRKRRAGVKDWSGRLLRGEYQYNGDPIRISSCGVLLDGQHRLSAVHETGIPILTVIATGLDKSARSTIDKGCPRTIGDDLEMEGYVGGNRQACKNLASSVKLILHILDGDEWTYNTKYSTEQVMEFIDHNEDVIDAVVTAGIKKKSGVVGEPAYRIAFYYLALKVNEQAAGRMINGLLSGRNLDDGSPTMLLRNKLQRHETKAESLNRNDRLRLYTACVASEMLERERYKMPPKSTRLELPGIESLRSMCLCYRSAK